MSLPIEPPRTRVRFPDPRRAGDQEVMAVGPDFSPGTILAAYRRGIFPWPQASDRVPWCSPDPRAVFPLEEPPHRSRSLRRTLRLHPYALTVDRAFRQVMRECGARRGGTWIIPEMIDAYDALHALGWAHSVEVWEGDELVGGIYGIAIGGVFAGESMFHRRTDTSKIAFAALTDRLRASGFALFDVQVMNDHLASLGCVELPRSEYLDRLAHAVLLPARWG